MPKPTFDEADFAVLADFEETRQAADADETDRPEEEPATDAERLEEEKSFAEAEESITDELADEELRDPDEDLTEETDSGVAAVRLPVEGAPLAEFSEEEPDEPPEADVEPEPEQPAKAREDASPFFEEWTPSDFESEETPVAAPTGETGDLASVEATDAPEDTEDEKEEGTPVPAPPAETPEPAAPAAARPARTTRHARRERTGERFRLPLILGGSAIVVVAALLLFWFLQDGPPAEPIAEPPVAQEEPAAQPPATSEPAEQPSGTEASSTDEPASAEPESAQPPPAAATPSSDDLTTIDRNAGAWTLVVASWTIRANADEELQRYAQQFRSRGYPVDLLTETGGDVTRYRVGVGAFPNQEAAEQALQRLSADLPDGTWLLRVRPGM